MPWSSWLAQGYVVQKGQKAIKSITYVDVKDDKGDVIRKVKRTVNLFHKRQVDKLDETKTNGGGESTKHQRETNAPDRE